MSLSPSLHYRCCQLLASMNSTVKEGKARRCVLSVLDRTLFVALKGRMKWDLFFQKKNQRDDRRSFRLWISGCVSGGQTKTGCRAKKKKKSGSGCFAFYPSSPSRCRARPVTNGDIKSDRYVHPPVFISTLTSTCALASRHSFMFEE